MERASKEHILREIRRLAADNGGASLGKERFEALTGITETTWRGRYWARWGDAVREAGLEPNIWQTRVHDDDSVLRMVALLVREYGHFPTTAELRLRRRDGSDDAPTDTVLKRRFGNKAQQAAKLLAFVDANPEFSDVAAICAAVAGSGRNTSQDTPTEASDRPVTGVVYAVRMAEFYKIGKTNDIDRRTRELRIQLPVKEELVHAIETDDPSGIEAYWHKRFATRRANGEWFLLNPEDVEAFKRRSYM